jgi:LPS-assembly protein
LSSPRFLRPAAAPARVTGRPLGVGVLLLASACGSAWAQLQPFAPSASAPRLPVTVEADSISARPDVDVSAEGSVKMKQGPMVVTADRVTYQQASDLARAQGNVVMTRYGDRYSGQELQLYIDRFEGFLADPTYFFSRIQAGGSAKRLEFLGRDAAKATGATYTSCDRDDPAWLMSTDEVTLDFANNEGTAKGAVLRFYGVPILAAPTLTFPLTDERKSGWLPPTVGIDSKSGAQLSVPYYWNIAPNRDATITPAIYSKRGVALGTQFRYLQPDYEGLLDMDVLPDDRLTGITRGRLDFKHEGLPDSVTQYSARISRVTDDDYWKDFPHAVDSPAQRLLGGDFRVSREIGDFTAYARVLRWQLLRSTSDPLFSSSQILPGPYDRAPQVGTRGAHKLGGGFDLSLEGEYNRFVNPDGYLPIDPVTGLQTTRPTGERVHALAALSWSYATAGWTLTPKMSVNSAAYSLDEPLTSGRYQGQTRVDRTIPTFSLDSAWVLERETTFLGRGMRQTLEPRLFYVKTAYRDQHDLPNFDSAEKDFNFDSIYTENAFSGVDRVSDAHQLTTGVTSRFVDANTGSEALRLGIAQRFLFQDQQVTPDNQPDTEKLSDLLLLASSNVGNRWKIDTSLQYSTDTSRWVRSLIGATYSPGPYRTVTATYRLKRGTSEQVELGWQWPVYGTRPLPTGSAERCSGAWYSVGRVNYSMLDSRVTDAILGFEYDSGCWIGRVVAKRLSTGLREETTQIGFEIEFVGLSRLGTNPLSVLKDNIPGYRPLRNTPSSELSASPSSP